MSQRKLGLIIACLVALIGGLAAGVSTGFLESSELNQLSGEINKTNKQENISLGHNTAQFILIDRKEASFYIDYELNGGINEEIKELKRDGEIHRKKEIIDFRNNSYVLTFSYTDNREKEGDAWLRFETSKPLKPER